MCEFLTGWGSWDYTEQQFIDIFHVDEWHKKIGLEEMILHAFLTEDMKAEEVFYGDRYKMTFNFDNQARSINGKEYKPYEYRIESDSITMIMWVSACHRFPG